MKLFPTNVKLISTPRFILGGKSSNNFDNFNLPNLYFFQPKRIWIIYENHIEALYIDSKQIEIDWIEINKIMTSTLYIRRAMLNIQHRCSYVELVFWERRLKKN